MELFRAVYCILLFLSSHTQGSNAELVEKTSKSERRDVDTCVDNPLCATLPDICTNLDQALVKAQCPAKCGLCPTSEQTTLATVITTSPITTTTSSSTERYCVFDICMNGGTCVVVLSRHICECPQGVTGKYCESVHVSASFVTPTISTHSTTTQQTTPFPVSAPTSGPCDVSPCINGGSCVANGFMFTCSCPDGYSGPLCNIAPSVFPSTTVTTAAAVTPTPVNGIWGSWSHYTCSVTCGNGTEIRHRSCNNPSPAHGGHTCLGGNLQIRRCQAQPCPVNGIWGHWGHYTCSVTCGNGTKTRHRSCNNPSPAHGGHTCPGEHVQTRSCQAQPCPATTKTPTTTHNSLCRTNIHELGCQPADVVFMIQYAVNDALNCSIDHQGDFIKTQINRWIKPTSYADMRVGVVTYHNTAEERIHLHNFSNIHHMNAAITNITGNCPHGNQEGGILQPSGHANLADAFDFVRTNSFKGHRPGHPQVVIPIIHTHMRKGWSTNLLAASQRLKDACVSILPIVVLYSKENENGHEIAHQIASGPSDDFYTEFSRFANMEQSVNHGRGNDLYGSSCVGQ